MTGKDAVNNTGVIKPLRLLDGDTIGVVAPSSSFDLNNFKTGIKMIRKLGYKVKYERVIFNKCWSRPGHNKQRAKQINRMFADEEVKAIFCAKAGYGSVEILPYLDKEVIRRNPKIFMGYSDITNLLLYLQRIANMVVFHGPVVSDEIYEGMNFVTLDCLMRTIGTLSPLGKMMFPQVRMLRAGKADGVLAGGNLYLLVESIGTPYEIDTKDKILFLEDIGEDKESLSKSLRQLKETGKFESVKALIFGRMINCFEEPHDIRHVIDELFASHDIPMLFGFPSGHVKSRGDANVTLPFGIEVSIDSAALTVEIKVPAVR